MTHTTTDAAEARALTDAQLKDAVTELLSHRGERPWRVLRGGQELWETWLPAFRAALRYLPATAEAASGAGERERAFHEDAADAIRSVTATMRRMMPNACGDWADQIDQILRTSVRQ